LVNLVDAIAAAGIETRNTVERSHSWSARQMPVVFSLIELGLYQRPLVCVHPAAGTIMRRWPAHRYAELIDLLIATEDVDIGLIGGADEAEIGDEVIKNIE